MDNESEISAQLEEKNRSFQAWQTYKTSITRQERYMKYKAVVQEKIRGLKKAAEILQYADRADTRFSFKCTYGLQYGCSATQR